MNDLTKLTKDMGAPKDLALTLTTSLTKFFDDAEAERKTIDSIVVTSPDQVEEMQKAREIRLKIKNKRIEARDIVKDQREKIKFAMADFTLQDKLWLKAWQMLEATCDNLEAKCEHTEKFAERYEAEQKQIRYEQRVSKLVKYGTDPSIYALSDMPDETFDRLLETEHLAYEARIEGDKKAEAERIAKEKSERDEQERIRKENELLRKQAAEREKKLEKERAEQQKKLDAERKAREAAEAKIKAEKDAQARKEAEEKARIDAITKADEEAARKKLLAPDKEKLIDLANAIEQIALPAVSSKEASSVVRATEEMLGKITNYIREKAKAL